MHQIELICSQLFSIGLETLFL